MRNTILIIALALAGCAGPEQQQRAAAFTPIVPAGIAARICDKQAAGEPLDVQEQQVAAVYCAAPAALTAGEVDVVRRQIAGCWILPAGVDQVDDVAVQIRLQLAPDRTVQRVTIEDEHRLESDAAYRAVAQSAMRAVASCSPLGLPEAKYALWRDLVMTFDPGEAMGTTSF